MRTSARDIWQATTGRRAIWDNLQVHHRIPLEWSHLFPKADPNRLSNLVGINSAAHTQVTNAWNAWKQGLNGRIPTQAEIMEQALPSDYFDFLATTNGATFQNDIRFGYQTDIGWIEPEYEESGKLAVLFGIGDGKAYDLRGRANDYGFRSRIPANVIPIGRELGWNYFGLDCQSGEIWYWQLGEIFELGEVNQSMEELNWVANSFQSFWLSLRQVR